MNYRMGKAAAGDKVARVELWVSPDRGRTWKLEESAPPGTDWFTFQARKPVADLDDLGDGRDAPQDGDGAPAERGRDGDRPGCELLAKEGPKPGWPSVPDSLKPSGP
jgi:hypothetical protein